MITDLAGRIAVVTGAASGIGRSLAERFAAEGMKVVLADIEADALEAAAADLRPGGAEVLAVQTDVADRSSVDHLAERTIEAFGTPHVLCNNAGVSGTFGPIWETTSKDWDWVLGVNLMGVVHGIQAFVPAMISTGEPGHVVNTSSVLGLSTGSGSIYSTTKHAVTRLTEGLWYDLRSSGTSIGASVLCPGLIATQIVTAGRNRPDHLRNQMDEEEAAAVEQRMSAAQEFFLQSGMPPAEVADMVVDAIRTDRFYVLTHPDMILQQVQTRTDSIINGSPPPPEDPGDTFLNRALRERGTTPKEDPRD
jgi:NAD(P)-dependent dehydrogenase (short-subunit alcohol dehydrogenase family)